MRAELRSLSCLGGRLVGACAWLPRGVFLGSTFYLSYVSVFMPVPYYFSGFPGGARDKEPTCQCRRHRDAGSIPGSEI